MKKGLIDLLFVAAMLSACSTSNLEASKTGFGQITSDEVGVVVQKQIPDSDTMQVQASNLCKTGKIIRPKANLGLAINFHYFSDRTLQPMFLWTLNTTDPEQKLDLYCLGQVGTAIGNFVLKNPVTGYAPNFNIPTFPDKLFAYPAAVSGNDPDQIFTIVNPFVPYVQIRHTQSGLCWQVQSTSINARVLMKPCDANNIMQLFDFPI
jgi:hypothetical protein